MFRVGEVMQRRLQRVVARCILQERWSLAERLLRWCSHDEVSFFWHSALLRLENRYKQEFRLLSKNRRRFQDSVYFNEREAWFALPLFERLVPRMSVRVPRESEQLPSKEILENSIFLSGADSGYFEHLVQLFESLQASELYCKMPLGVLDCGLEQWQREYLRRRFPVSSIVTPSWPVEPAPGLVVAGKPLCEGHKAIMCKPFLPNYFPDWRYVLWFDADSWIHDERAVDRFLLQLERAPIAITSFDSDGFTHVATGVFGVRRDTSILERWQKLYQEQLASEDFLYASEENILRTVLLEHEFFDFLPTELLYRLWIEGIPYCKVADSTLYVPRSGEPLGIYAFDAHTDKSVAFWPTQERSGPIEGRLQQFLHKRKSSKVLLSKQTKLSGRRFFKNQREISLYYRDWPWRDKPALRRALTSSARSFLERDELDGYSASVGNSDDLSASEHSAIPTHFHMLWGMLQDSSQMPDEFVRNMSICRLLHPDWELRIHGSAEMKELLRSYPTQPFLEYPLDIQRSDVARILCLHRYGGVYTDLDVQMLRTVEELCDAYPHANVLLAVETMLSKRQTRFVGKTQKIRNGVPELPMRIANYFMASTPGHPIWNDVLEMFRERSLLPIRCEYDVLYTTGPDVITEVAHRAAEQYPDVVIVPQTIIEKYIIHRNHGSWRGLPQVA